MRSSSFPAVALLSLCGLTALVALPAHADPFPGQPFSLKAGAGNIRSLFSVTNDGKTINFFGDPTGANTWFLDSVDAGEPDGQLIGIRTIFLVTLPGATEPTDIAAISKGGFVSTYENPLDTDKEYWEGTVKGYAPVYDADDPGRGFPDDNTGEWLVLGNPSLAGKGGLNEPYIDFGSFTFSESILNANQTALKYGVGFDFLLAGRNNTPVTARGYTSSLLSPDGPGGIFEIPATPEANGMTLAFSALSIPLAGLALSRRRKHRPAA